MIKDFRQKPAQLQGIEVTDLLNQLPGVANLIGAKKAEFSTDSKGSVGNFSIEGRDTVYQVREGQVVALLNGVITVMDAPDFYSKYEAV